MGAIAPLAAAIAAYAFGAVWYMVLAKPWMAAAGMTEEQVQNGSKLPFLISAIAVILVAGMMRHIFSMAGIEGFGKGALTGIGLGLFIATPWIVTNYSYSDRPRNLMLIDGGYATFGCTIMGAVLGIF